MYRAIHLSTYLILFVNNGLNLYGWKELAVIDKKIIPYMETGIAVNT